MNVIDKKVYTTRHSIEFGYSSWDDKARSVRNRWDTPEGRFSPRSSSEIPLSDMPDIVIETAKRDWIDVEEARRMIEALTASIARQQK